MVSPTRRPGVDADLVQTGMVRGIDTKTPTPPGDLLVSPGQSSVTSDVSEVRFWNRTDDAESPLFVLSPGSDLGLAPRVAVFVRDITDPGGVISAEAGSLFISNTNPATLWLNQSGGSASWKKISDDLGGENLAQTLAIGNFTGGLPIQVDPGDFIQGKDTVDATPAGELVLRSGNATGPGAGSGLVSITTGSAADGGTGNLILATSAQTAGFQTGTVLLASGSSTAGPAGGLTVSAGDGDPPGGILIRAGDGNGPVGISNGGALTMRAGSGQPGGMGGAMELRAGSTVAVPPTPVIPVAGKGGDLRLRAGWSAAGTFGGSVIVSGGAGGPAGGDGGSVFLSPGPGQGGGVAGQVYATGIFSASNILRGVADPNAGGGTPAPEGSIYQRTTVGFGEVWFNRTGQPQGWSKIGLSGDFVESFSRTQYGFLTVSSAGSVLSSTGLWAGGVGTTSGPSATISRGSDDVAPILNIGAGLPGDYAAIEVPISSPLQRRHNLVATFKFRPQVVSLSSRSFIGLASATASTMVTSNLPVAEYIGIQKVDGIGTWRYLSRGALGVNAGTSFTLSADPHYLVLDCSDQNLVRFLILDRDMSVIGTYTIDAVILAGQVPQLTTNLLPCCSLACTDAIPKSLYLYSASVVTDTSFLGGGGNIIGATQTLAQTLAVGNTTGGNPIIVSAGDFVASPNTTGPAPAPPLDIQAGSNTGLSGDGGSLTVQGGATPNVGAGGSVRVRARNGGNISGAGGAVLIQAGNSNTQGGAAPGDVTIEAGDATANTGNGGSIILNPGASVGGSPGEVLINGKLTVTGLIDPPGLVLDEQETCPYETQGKGQGLLWVHKGTGELWYRNKFGQDAPLAQGGNNPPTLAQVLTAGNTTGGKALVLSAGDVLRAEDDPQGGVALTVRGGSCSGPAGDGGHLVLQGGTATGGGTGGDIQITPGSNGGAVKIQSDSCQLSGALSVAGILACSSDLQVAGTVQSPGLVISASAAPPAAPLGEHGVLWTKGKNLYFVTADGEVNLSTGGGPVSLGSLSDVDLQGLGQGKVLTWNGAAWQPGDPGVLSTLETILGAGNTTGPTDLVISKTAVLRGEDNGVGNAEALLVRAGDGLGLGGSLTLRGGNSTGGGAAGPLNLLAGSTSSGDGGHVSILATPALGVGVGGNLLVRAGAGAGGGDAGAVQIVAGLPTVPFHAGSVTLFAAPKGNTEPAFAFLNGGTGTKGGGVALGAGGAAPLSTSSGGDFEIAAGAGGGGLGSKGGDVLISSGGCNGSTAGSIRLKVQPGAVLGQIYLDGKLNDDSEGMKFGSIVLGQGGTQIAITFTTPFATTPTCVTYSVSCSVDTPAHRIVGGSVSASGFSVRFQAAVPSPVTIFWRANF